MKPAKPTTPLSLGVIGLRASARLGVQRGDAGDADSARVGALKQIGKMLGYDAPLQIEDVTPEPPLQVVVHSIGSDGQEVTMTTEEARAFNTWKRQQGWTRGRDGRLTVPPSVFEDGQGFDA